MLIMAISGVLTLHVAPASRIHGASILYFEITMGLFGLLWFCNQSYQQEAN
jgi:hypothetical protein